MHITVDHRRLLRAACGVAGLAVSAFLLMAGTPAGATTGQGQGSGHSQSHPSGKDHGHKPGGDKPGGHKPGCGTKPPHKPPPSTPPGKPPHTPPHKPPHTPPSTPPSTPPHKPAAPPSTPPSAAPAIHLPATHHPATPAKPATSTTLANTGASDVPMLLGIAGGLLVAGSGAVVVGTRKVRRS